jgi:hypothetical protein
MGYDTMSNPHPTPSAAYFGNWEASVTFLM